jgi:hypothetical protein
MKRAAVVCLAVLLTFVSVAQSQTRRRARPKKPVARRVLRPTTTYEEKQQAEIRAGRQRIASQIKALAQFLYLFAGISKGIETAEQVNRNREDTSVGMSPEQIEKNKMKVRDSIKTVRAGLDELEASFRTNPALTSYYPNLAGVAKIGQTAESQAAASSFDQAGRSLVNAVNKLTDALVSVR